MANAILNFHFDYLNPSLTSTHTVWHSFKYPESQSKEVSGLVAASAQEAHVIKGKRVNILKLEIE